MEKKRLPDLCSRKEDCCGCSACAASCPTDAIHMCPDEKGFFYPKVDQDACVRCYQCEKICPFKKKKN